MRPAWTGSTSRLTRFRRETFMVLARRDRLADVLAGLAAAAAAGMAPVKVNSVLMRGVNDHEAVAAAPVLPGAAVTSFASSSRCRWTRSMAGAARIW